MHMLIFIMIIGAESVIKKEGNKIIKTRIKKSYRLEKLDEKIRKTRNKKEANFLRKVRRLGLNVPNIFYEGDFSIEMNFIDGKIVKDIFNENFEYVSEKIGKMISVLHKNNIIHGDLTTSNMILKNRKLYLIDFGLGFFSQKIEDKAMDLYLLKTILESTHFLFAEKSWKIIIKNYNFEKEQIIKTLSKIEKRGRYNKR